MHIVLTQPVNVMDGKNLLAMFMIKAEEIKWVNEEEKKEKEWNIRLMNMNKE